MDGNTGPEITPAPLSPQEGDSFGGEKRPSRETVISTFNSAFDLFKNTPETELNPEELSARDHLAEIKTKTINVGKDSYINNFTGKDGKKYTQTEHIPLEGLTAFLSKKHADAVSEGNTELEKTLKKQLEVLLEKKTGVPYVRVPRRRMADPKYIARVMAEADRIQKDPRLTSGNARADYIRANQLLTKRWELIIPKEAMDGGTDPTLPKEEEKAKELILPKDPKSALEQIASGQSKPKEGTVIDIKTQEEVDGKDKMSSVELPKGTTAEKPSTPEGPKPMNISEIPVGTRVKTKGGKEYVVNGLQTGNSGDPILEMTPVGGGEKTYANQYALDSNHFEVISQEADQKLDPKDQPIIKNPDRLKPQHTVTPEYPEGAGEIPAGQISGYVPEEPTPEAATTTPPTTNAETDLPEGAGEISADRIADFLGGDGPIPPESPPTPPTPPEPPDPIGEIPSGMVAEALGEAPTTTPVETTTPAPEVEILPEDLPPVAPTIEIKPEELATPTPAAAPREAATAPAEEPPVAAATIAEVREYNAMIANRTEDIRKHAAVLAENHLRAEQRKGKLWNPLSWARKSKMRILEEYYRQKYIKEATEAMLANNNSLLEYDFAKKAATNTSAMIEQGKAAGTAKIDQLKTGEKIKGQTISIVEGEIRNKIIAEFIKPITDGTLTSEKELQDKLKAFIARDDIKDDPQIKALFGNESTQYGIKADFFATDLLEMGRQIKADKDVHGFSLEQIDSHIKIQFANTSWAAETQVQWSLADKAIAWSQRNGKRGWFTNPAVVGAITSIGLYGGMRAAGMGGKTLLAAAPGAGLLVGATFAAVRRAHDLKVDRASHQIETTYGDKSDESAKRRRKLDTFNYDRTSVATLLNGGSEERRTVGGDRRGLNELLNLNLSSENPESTQNREALARRIAEIRARLDYSAANKVDLVTFESKQRVEQGRLELIKGIVEARMKLQAAGMSTDQVDTAINQSYGEWSQQFLSNRETQDKAFNRYRVKQSLISAGIGGASGLAFGLGAGVVFREAMEHTIGNTHISGLEGIPGLNKLTGTADNAKEHMQALHGENKPTQVGDLMLSRDASDHIITTTPDGLSQVHDNWTMNSDGHIFAKGEIPDDIKKQFKMDGFDISEDVDKQPFTFDTSLPSNQDQLPGLHHQVFVPHGTGWIEDPNAPGKWDLVADGHPDQVFIHDAVVTPDGQSITYDSAHSAFGADAFTSDRPVEIQPAGVVSRDVFGHEGLWEKNGTLIDHREWFGNNTRVSDLNELRVDNSLQTAANGEKVLIWDANRMTVDGSFQDGNHPPIVNVPELIRQGKLGLAVSTPDNQQNPIFIPFGTDGRSVWDPTDTTHHIGGPDSMTYAEASKMFLDQQKLSQFPDGSLESELNNHQDIFTLGKGGKPGYIEVVQVKTIDGKTVLQPFATAAGTGNAPATIDIPIPAKTDTVIDIIPKNVVFDHTITEMSPPSDHEIPFIPWVVTPRFPLETLPAITFPPPIGSYYGGATLGELQTWVQENPDSHKQYIKRKGADGKDEWVDTEGNPIKRDTKREREVIKKYLDSLKVKDSPHYGLLEKLTAELPPMKESTRVSVNIPAWMEGENLYKVLEEYTQQTDNDGNPLDPNLYEINIIVNRKRGDAPDNSVEEIKRFIRTSQEDGKQFNINYIDLEFDPPFNNVGNARRVITDLTLLRSVARDKQSGPLYLESEDADLISIDRKTVTNIISKMDENPHLDAVRGIQDRNPEQMMENDFLFMYRRLQDFKELIIRRNKYRPENNPNANFTWNRVITGGWNTAYSAEAYSLIGGYNPYQTKGEDMIMGERMSMIRGDGTNPNTQVIGKVATRTDSSPRRYIWEVASGKAAYGDSFEDPAVNAEIRNKTPEQLMERISFLSRIDESNKVTFQQMINSEFDFLKATTPNEADAKEVAKLILLYLGFSNKGGADGKGDYKFSASGKIEITNWANAKKALDDYRERHANPTGSGVRTGYKNSPTPTSLSPSESTITAPPSSPPKRTPTGEAPPPRSTTTLESSTEIGGSIEHMGGRTASATEKKPSHTKNQDTIIENSEKGYIGTFDGLGGHGGGDIASNIAGEKFREEFDKLSTNPTKEQIHTAVNAASLGSIQAMKEYVTAHPENPDLEDMATTASVVKLYEEGGEKFAYILQSGDSRSYAFKTDGTLLQISDDQSTVSQDQEAGIITEADVNEINKALDEAKSLEDIKNKNPLWTKYWYGRNMVSGVIGTNPGIAPNLKIGKITSQTQYIITTSDGVHDNLTPLEIASCLQGKATPQEAAQAVLSAAKTRAKEGGFRSKEDDISVVIIEVNPKDATPYA